MRSQYLYAMIHPDHAVENGMEVKMYSDVPVPTATISFRQSYQLSTNANGCFGLIWSPNFLATTFDSAA